MKVINFCGAACAGKSTAALNLAAELKERYIEVELIDEYAKRLVLAGAQHLLADQMTVLADQNGRQYFASLPQNGLEYVVTDSPLFLSAFYAPHFYPPSFKPLVLDLFRGYDNLNIFLERNHRYNPKGRLQTEAEADADSARMKQFLNDNGIPFITMKAGPHVRYEVLNLLGIERHPKPVFEAVELALEM
jgi:nicotinamide riboside kinase